jgi:hypothetical protein
MRNYWKPEGGRIQETLGNRAKNLAIFPVGIGDLE